MTVAKLIGQMVVKELEEWYPCHAGYAYESGANGAVVLVQVVPQSAATMSLGNAVYEQSFDLGGVTVRTDVTELSRQLARDFIVGTKGLWTDTEVSSVV